MTGRPQTSEERILKVLRAVPSGRIASYGQIARIAGLPRNARQVGAILKKLPAGSDVPWHRIVNARGIISSRGDNCEKRQRILLQLEGIRVDDSHRIDVRIYGWDGITQGN